MKSVFLALISVSALLIGACNSQKKSVLNKKSNVVKEVDYFGEYSLENKFYGSKTVVTIKKGFRKIVTNGLPNHNIGKFPNIDNPNRIYEQNITYSLPLKPFYTGQKKWVKEIGVALNGIRFEPETTERYTCESGEEYRLEAIQQLVNFGLDFNNAHVEQSGTYHYHAKPVGILRFFDTGNDLIHIGFAKDGFPMYYSKSGAYKSSYRLLETPRKGTNCSYNGEKPYDKDLNGTQPDGTFIDDWEYVHDSGDLDECNGIRINGSYVYLITDEYPFIGRCLNGKFTE